MNNNKNTRLMALCPGLPGWAGTRKVKPIWIYWSKTVSGISWAIRKSAPRPRQITMPASHHSGFCRPDALLTTQPTASKHWRHILFQNDHNNNINSGTTVTTEEPELGMVTIPWGCKKFEWCSIGVVMSGARCTWSAYGSADVTATHHLLLH